MRTVLTLAVLVCVAAGIHGQARPPEKVPDLYNLGPLGAKACVENRAGGADGKATALVIERLVSDGPAARAGLKLGDRIVAVAGKDFGHEAYLELAAAIQAAELAEEPVLKFSLLRGDQRHELSATLAPPARPADSDVPDTAFADKLAERALAWLAARQQADGSWPCSISVENGLVVQTSLAGLCFLAAGHTPEKGDYAAHLRKAAEFVLEHVGEQKQYRTLQGRNNNQTHWSLGYGAIFLAHVLHHTDARWLGRSSLRGIKTKLGWIRGRIQSGMAESGGFGHGPGGPNILNYIELQAMSNLLLAALGCIKRCGLEPDEKKLDSMLAFARACVDDNGNVAYSTTPPQSAIRSPARSAGLSNALAALGRTDDPIYARVSACARANVARAFEGHSTPTMHQLAFAMACRRQGEAAWAEYWRANRREFTMARCPDGSFSYRPTAETLASGLNIDRDLSDVWTTSHWTLVLCLARDGLPLWRG